MGDAIDQLVHSTRYNSVVEELEDLFVHTKRPQFALKINSVKKQGADYYGQEQPLTPKEVKQVVLKGRLRSELATLFGGRPSLLGFGGQLRTPVHWDWRHWQGFRLRTWWKIYSPKQRPPAWALIPVRIREEPLDKRV